MCALISGRDDTVNLLCAPTLSVTIVRLCGVLLMLLFLALIVLCLFLLSKREVWIAGQSRLW